MSEERLNYVKVSGNQLKSFQLGSVSKIFEEDQDLITHSHNENAVFKTVSATPGLLKIM